MRASIRVHQDDDEQGEFHSLWVDQRRAELELTELAAWHEALGDTVEPVSQTTLQVTYAKQRGGERITYQVWCV